MSDKKKPARDVLRSLPVLHGKLWDWINAYVTSCGGDPSKHVYGNTPRMTAVVEIEAAIAEAIAADRLTP